MLDFYMMILSVIDFIFDICLLLKAKDDYNKILLIGFNIVILMILILNIIKVLHLR